MLWWGVSRVDLRNKEVAAVSVESHVHTADRSLFQCDISKNNKCCNLII